MDGARPRQPQAATAAIAVRTRVFMSGSPALCSRSDRTGNRSKRIAEINYRANAEKAFRFSDINEGPDEPARGCIAAKENLCGVGDRVREPAVRASNDVVGRPSGRHQPLLSG